MVRCEAITNSGSRCKCKPSKNSGNLCNVHIIIKCGLGIHNIQHSERIILTECGHKFCKSCLAKEIYNYQWFADFSTDHPLQCPTCDKELCDSDWEHIMDYSVKIKLVQRKIIYPYYLDKEWINKFYLYGEFKKEYTTLNHNQLNFIGNDKLTHDILPSKVYFQKWKFENRFPTTCFTFEIDYDLIKKQNESIFKELVEYVFHPDRVKRLGMWEYLESM